MIAGQGRAEAAGVTVKENLLHTTTGFFRRSRVPVYYYYKLAAPRKAFYLVHICHGITDPPVTKIRLWASFEV